MDLTSIDTPDALADWLAAGPTVAERCHAFNQLADNGDYDAAMATWRDGERLANQRLEAA